jgi:hypothetical protein
MPGSFVRVELSGQGGIATWIPADAVVRRGQLAGVFVLQEDVVRLRWIRLGLQRSAAVEVLAGLDGDARVVRSPAPHLTDGARVDRATETPFEGIEGGEPQLEVGL